MFTAEQEPLLGVIDATVRRFIDGVDYPPAPTLPGLDERLAARITAAIRDRHGPVGGSGARWPKTAYSAPG